MQCRFLCQSFPLYGLAFSSLLGTWKLINGFDMRPLKQVLAYFFLYLIVSVGHHTLNHPEERGVETGSARRSSLKGRERAFVSQTNIGIVLKATLGNRTSERRGEAHTGFPERIDTILD